MSHFHKLSYSIRYHQVIPIFFLFYSLNTFSQENKSYETIYALNSGATTRNVDINSNVKWGATTEFPNNSYIKIKKKQEGSYYLQTIVNGQFAYGHYFKYISTIDNGYKYQRTDSDENEFLISNYSLSDLAKSNQFDEKVRIELINYRTSFAMLLLF